MPLGRFDKSGNAMSVAGRTPGAVLRVPDTLTDFCPVIWLRAAASIGLAPVAVIFQFPVPFLARGVDRQSVLVDGHLLGVVAWNDIGASS